MNNETKTKTAEEIEAAIEQERIEWVFGLTGGEMADRPWTAYHVGKDETREQDDERARKYGWAPTVYDRVYPHRYWYEGAPEYLGKQYDHVTARTTLTWGSGYLEAPTPWLVDADGVWVFVESFNNSGECECPNRYWDPVARESPADMTVRIVTPQEANAETDCPLCEAKIGEEHGYIYIGEGYEAVYVLAAHQCDECGGEIHCPHPENFWEELCGCKSYCPECVEQDHRFQEGDL
jgi:hypothetical protein